MHRLILFILLVVLLSNGSASLAQVTPAQVKLTIDNKLWETIKVNTNGSESEGEYENPKYTTIDIYISCLISGSERIDTLSVLDMPAGKQFIFNINLNQTELIAVNIGEHKRIRMWLQPGQKKSLLLDEKNFQQTAFNYTDLEDAHEQKYMLEQLWKKLTKYDVKELDSIGYNKKATEILSNGFVLLQPFASKLDTLTYHRLLQYNNLLWAKAYTDFARYKRLTEHIKTFNSISPNYTNPVKEILYGIDDFDYFGSLFDKLCAFVSKAKRVSFQTNLLAPDELDCRDAFNSWDKKLERTTYLGTCKFGYTYKDYWIIAPMYDEVGYFGKNYAYVKLNDKYGVINKCGEWVIKPIYDNITFYDEALFIFTLNGKQGLMNIEEQILIPAKYLHIERIDVFGNYPIHDKLKDVLIAKDPITHKLGLINTRDSVLLPFMYDRIYGLGNEYIHLTLIDSSMSLLDRSGKKCYAELFGIADIDGKTIMPLSYQYVHYISVLEEDYFIKKNAYIQKKGKWEYNDDEVKQLVDKNNRLIYTGKFYAAANKDFPGIFHVLIFHASAWEFGKKYYLFGKNGQILLPYIIEISERTAGKLLVKGANNKFYVIKDDESPAVLDSFDRYELLQQSDFHYALYRDGKCAVMNRQFVRITDYVYEEVLEWNEFHKVKQQGKIYMYTAKNDTLCGGIGYDWVEPLTQNSFQAKYDDSISVFDSQYSFMFKIKGDRLLFKQSSNKLQESSSEWSDMKEDDNSEESSIMLNASLPEYLAVIKNGGLYEFKWSSKNAPQFKRMITGKVSVMYYYTGFKKNFVVLNTSGKVIDFGYTYHSKLVDLVNKKIIGTEYLRREARYEKFGNIVNIATGEPNLKMVSFNQTSLNPVYDLQTPTRQLSVYAGSDSIVIHSKRVKYFIFTTKSQKIGLLDLNGELKLDTVYDFMQDKNGFVFGFKFLNRKASYEENYFEGFKRLMVFNNQLQLIKEFDSVIRVDFKNEGYKISDTFTVNFANNRSGMYQLTPTQLINLKAEQIEFDDEEQGLYWVKRNKKWYLYDTSGNLRCLKPIAVNGWFRAGVAQLNYKFILKTGEFINLDRNRYAKQTTNLDVRKLYMPTSINIEHAISQGNCDYMTMQNFSNIQFSNYQYKSDSTKRKYFYELANDSRYPRAVVNAINMAFISRTHEAMYRHLYRYHYEHDLRQFYQFYYYSNTLFRFYRPFEITTSSDYKIKSALHNFVIINDSLYELNGDMEYYSREFDTKKWSELNTLFYQRIMAVKGIQHMSRYCPTPSYALGDYNAKMGITSDSVSFIVNLYMDNGETNHLTISFSHQEILPYLNKSKLLYRWMVLNRKQQ